MKLILLRLRERDAAVPLALLGSGLQEPKATRRLRAASIIGAPSGATDSHPIV
jgi:hypothetical protein